MIEAIDSFAVQMFLGSQSAFLDHMALTLTNAFTWVPLYIALLFLIVKNNDNMQQIGLCFLCGVIGVVISSVMADVIVKPFVERLRPCNDPEIKYIAQIAGNLRSKDFSFFSAHAANTMSLAVFFTLLVRNRLLGVSLVLWSLTNCWTRLYLGQHFMTDILVGLLWGIFTGCFCYFFYTRVFRRISPTLNFVSSQYTTTGYSLLDIDVVISVLVLTVLMSVII